MPSQVGFVCVEPEQVGDPQLEVGYSHADAPSQLPLQGPLALPPRHSESGSVPCPYGVHVPSEPVTLHASHSLSQPVSQHTSSTHRPLLHVLPFAHAVPLGSPFGLPAVPPPPPVPPVPAVPAVPALPPLPDAPEPPPDPETPPSLPAAPAAAPPPSFVLECGSNLSLEHPVAVTSASATRVETVANARAFTAPPPVSRIARRPNVTQGSPEVSTRSASRQPHATWPA